MHVFIFHQRSRSLGRIVELDGLLHLVDGHVRLDRAHLAVIAIGQGDLLGDRGASADLLGRDCICYRRGPILPCSAMLGMGKLSMHLKLANVLHEHSII